jgi:hypothetical protein
MAYIVSEAMRKAAEERGITVEQLPFNEMVLASSNPNEISRAFFELDVHRENQARSEAERAFDAERPALIAKLKSEGMSNSQAADVVSGLYASRVQGRNVNYNPQTGKSDIQLAQEQEIKRLEEIKKQQEAQKIAETKPNPVENQPKIVNFSPKTIIEYTRKVETGQIPQGTSLSQWAQGQASFQKVEQQMMQASGAPERKITTIKRDVPAFALDPELRNELNQYGSQTGGAQYGDAFLSMGGLSEKDAAAVLAYAKTRGYDISMKPITLRFDSKGFPVAETAAVASAPVLFTALPNQYQSYASPKKQAEVLTEEYNAQDAAYQRDIYNLNAAQTRIKALETKYTLDPTPANYSTYIDAYKKYSDQYEGVKSKGDTLSSIAGEINYIAPIANAAELDKVARASAGASPAAILLTTTGGQVKSDGQFNIAKGITTYIYKEPSGQIKMGDVADTGENAALYNMAQNWNKMPDMSKALVQPKITALLQSPSGSMIGNTPLSDARFNVKMDTAPLGARFLQVDKPKTNTKIPTADEAIWALHLQTEKDDLFTKQSSYPIDTYFKKSDSLKMDIAFLNPLDVGSVVQKALRMGIADAYGHAEYTRAGDYGQVIDAGIDAKYLKYAVAQQAQRENPSTTILGKEMPQWLRDLHGVLPDTVYAGSLQFTGAGEKFRNMIAQTATIGSTTPPIDLYVPNPYTMKFHKMTIGTGTNISNAQYADFTRQQQAGIISGLSTPATIAAFIAAPEIVGGFFGQYGAAVVASHQITAPVGILTANPVITNEGLLAAKSLQTIALTAPKVMNTAFGLAAAAKSGEYYTSSGEQAWSISRAVGGGLLFGYSMGVMERAARGESPLGFGVERDVLKNPVEMPNYKLKLDIKEIDYSTPQQSITYFEVGGKPLFGATSGGKVINTPLGEIAAGKPFLGSAAPFEKGALDNTVWFSGETKVGGKSNAEYQLRKNTLLSYAEKNSPEEAVRLGEIFKIGEKLAKDNRYAILTPNDLTQSLMTQDGAALSKGEITVLQKYKNSLTFYGGQSQVAQGMISSPSFDSDLQYSRSFTELVDKKTSPEGFIDAMKEAATKAGKKVRSSPSEPLLIQQKVNGEWINYFDVHAAGYGDLSGQSASNTAYVFGVRKEFLTQFEPSGFKISTAGTEFISSSLEGSSIIVKGGLGTQEHRGKDLAKFPEIAKSIMPNNDASANMQERFFYNRPQKATDLAFAAAKERGIDLPYLQILDASPSPAVKGKVDLGIPSLTFAKAVPSKIKISPPQAYTAKLTKIVSPLIIPRSSPSTRQSFIMSPSASPSRKVSISQFLPQSLKPSSSSSRSQSISPSISPSLSPSLSPSRSPSKSPSMSPSLSPSLSPSRSPSRSPSFSPSLSPSISPSPSPSPHPPKDPPTGMPFATGGFLVGEPKRKGGRSSRKYKYTADLTANIMNIRSKSQSFGAAFTGQGIRAIVDFGMGSQNKSRKSKKSMKMGKNIGFLGFKEPKRKISNRQPAMKLWYNEAFSKGNLGMAGFKEPKLGKGNIGLGSIKQKRRKKHGRR